MSRVPQLPDDPVFLGPYRVIIDGIFNPAPVRRCFLDLTRQIRPFLFEGPPSVLQPADFVRRQHSLFGGARRNRRPGKPHGPECLAKGGRVLPPAEEEQAGLLWGGVQDFHLKCRARLFPGKRVPQLRFAETGGQHPNESRRGPRSAETEGYVQRLPGGHLLQACADALDVGGALRSPLLPIEHLMAEIHDLPAVRHRLFKIFRRNLPSPR